MCLNFVIKNAYAIFFVIINLSRNPLNIFAQLLRKYNIIIIHYKKI